MQNFKLCICECVYCIRAVYRNFVKGGRIRGMEKEGGAEADYSIV